MNQYLEGVSWKVVVDAAGPKIHDLTEQFILAFGDVEQIQKNAIKGFIEFWTGKSGNYTYRKYSKEFREAGLINYDQVNKVFKPTFHCKNKFFEIKQFDNKNKCVKILKNVKGKNLH